MRNSRIFKPIYVPNITTLEWFFSRNFISPIDNLPTEFIAEAIKNQNREFIGDKTEPLKFQIPHNTKPVNARRAY